MAVTDTGRLLTWGGGHDGILADDNVLVPTFVPGVQDVVGLATNEYHSLISTRGGKVMAFGSCGKEGEGYHWGDVHGDGSEIALPDGRLGLGADVTDP